MSCDCLTLMDEKPKPHNSRVQVTFTFGGDGSCRAYIPTEKIEPRNRNKMGGIARICARDALALHEVCEAAKRWKRASGGLRDLARTA